LNHVRPFPLVALCALGLSALVTSPGSAADPASGDRWPAWRGADGQGIADGAGIPLEWSATKNVLWKTVLPGRGLSSPVVWGDRSFLTTAIEGEVVPGTEAIPHVLEGKPVAVDGHLLLTSEEGDTFVVKAGPEFEIVGQNPLDEPVGASAAVVGGRIYIRGHQHLFAIGDAPAS